MPKNKFRYVLIALGTFWGTVSGIQIRAADWTSFRNGGESRVTDELPLKWSPQQGIAWQCELPGYGQSTPIVQQGRVYLTAVVGTMKERCLLVCYDLQNGQPLWELAIDSANPSASNYMASRAAPTPVVDQRAVYAFYETGNLLAVSLQGEQLWQRDITAEYGKFDNNHGLGSSPAQNATHVFLNIEHRGPSYILAIDKQTGETAWKIDRPSGSSWSSPIVALCGGREQLIVSSGGRITGYATSDGSQLWELEGFEGNTVPSPTLAGSKLFVGARLPEFAAEGSVRNNACIELANSASQGPEVLWRSDKAVSDYCSPVVAGAVTYFVNKGGILYCVDSETGELNYTKRLGFDCWGTPMVFGDLVYFFGKDGRSQVVRAGATYEVLAENQLWDEASPPKPERYVEYSGGSSGHSGGPRENSENGAARGNVGASTAADSETTEQPPRRRGGAGGMLAALMAGDVNGDGVLQASELSADFKPMLSRLDTNSDNALDAAELKAMADSFAARRADSQASARDPIVYGAAAGDGRLLIRTGTRLFCVQRS